MRAIMLCCTCTLLTVAMAVVGQTQDTSLDRIIQDMDKLLEEREVQLANNRLELGHFGQALNYKARNLIGNSDFLRNSLKSVSGVPNVTGDGQQTRDGQQNTSPYKQANIIETFHKFLQSKENQENHLHYRSLQQRGQVQGDKEADKTFLEQTGEVNDEQDKLKTIDTQRSLPDTQRYLQSRHIFLPDTQRPQPEIQRFLPDTKRPISDRPRLVSDSPDPPHSPDLPIQLTSPGPAQPSQSGPVTTSTHKSEIPTPHSQAATKAGSGEAGEAGEADQDDKAGKLGQASQASQADPPVPAFLHESDLTAPVSQPVILEQKRAEIHDQPGGDGLFLVLALCAVLCSMLAMVGVGFYMNRGRHQQSHRGESPYTDISPSFQSSKLTFASSPQDKPRGGPLVPQDQFRSGEGVPACGGQTVRGSRADIYRGGLGHLGQGHIGKGHIGQGQDNSWNMRSAKRMDSLIDIAGPEEDDEDDMIYECPGLAPHGEMEVTNPFFLSKDLDLLSKADGKKSPPCPVTNNNNIRHGSINRNLLRGFQ